MEGSDETQEETPQDPGLAEAPTGAPEEGAEEGGLDEAQPDEDTVPETDDQPGGSPDTEDEDVEPEGGGASDTEGTPDASGASA